MFYDKIKGMNTSTTRSITYNGDTIEYELTIKRVKNINMRVHKDGSVHISANAYVPDHRIDAFVIENIPFIERARFKLEALTAQRIEALQYVTGETVSILGMPVTLEVLETSGKPHIKFDGSNRMVMFVKSDYIYEEAELTKEQNKDKMLKDKIIVLNHYSQFSKDDKEVIEELIVKLVTARDSMRLKPEYKMGLENYLE